MSETENTLFTRTAEVELRDGKGRVLSKHRLSVETEFLPRSTWHGLDELIDALEVGQKLVEAGTGRVIAGRL